MSKQRVTNGRDQDCAIKNEYIFNVVQAFDEVSVSFEAKYSLDYTLSRMEQDLIHVAFVVPSNVFVETLIEINSVKSISLGDRHKEKSKEILSNNVSVTTVETFENDYFLVGCKKSFGNWKVEIRGTEDEVTDTACCLLSNQMKRYNYVTVEITRSLCCKLYKTHLFSRINELMTFIPTGYNGYLIDIDLYQENIREVVGDAIALFKDTAPLPPVTISHRSILSSIAEADIKSRSNIRDRDELSFIRPLSNQERLIHLNKQEVSFLLGRNGARITEIRNRSGCLIYVLPVANQLESSRKKTFQTIKLVGSKDKIENASLLIESHLVLFRENGSKFM